MKGALLLLILTLSIYFPGCATPAATRPPHPGTQLHLSPEARAELERRQREKAMEVQNTFNAFSSKLDEYQDVLSVCERVPDSDDARWIKASCKERLEKLRQELIQLRETLQEQ